MSVKLKLSAPSVMEMIDETKDTLSVLKLYMHFEGYELVKSNVIFGYSYFLNKEVPANIMNYLNNFVEIEKGNYNN